MSNTKITDLAALTGVTLAVLDKFVVVDVSDTTMASSGTDKSMVPVEVAVGLGTLCPGVNTAPTTNVTVQANYGVVVPSEYVLSATVETIFTDPSELAVV